MLKIKRPAFVGCIKIVEGNYLLGGVKCHESWPFETEQMALDYLSTIKSIEEGISGKKVETWVKPVLTSRAIITLDEVNGSETHN